VLGDVFMQAITLANRNTQLKIDQVPETPFSIQRVQPVGSDSIYLSSQCRHPRAIFGFSLGLVCSAEGRQESFEDYTLVRPYGQRRAVVRSLAANLPYFVSVATSVSMAMAAHHRN
jgi:hypothetical protein